jgi:predicted nucleic acid-binding protein
MLAAHAAGKVVLCAQLVSFSIFCLTHKALILQDREVVAAALEIFRSRPALGFSDCLLLEVARKAGHLPLGTFDRNLSKLEGADKL